MSRSTKDYEIGRGRPPKATQWKKGQSANPGGRKSPRSIGLLEMIDKLLLTPVKVAVNGRDTAAIEAVVALGVEEGQSVEVRPRAGRSHDLRAEQRAQDRQPGQARPVNVAVSGPTRAPTRRVPATSKPIGAFGMRASLELVRRTSANECPGTQTSAVGVARAAAAISPRCWVPPARRR